MKVDTEVYRSGLTRHLLKLSYRLPAFSDPIAKLLNPGDGSYRDYLRVYLPEHAAIAGVQVTIDGTVVSTRATTLGVEHGRKVVGLFFNLPPGHEAQVQVAYEVALAPGSSYQLYLQKQAGSPGLPTSLQISFPGGRGTRAFSLERDVEASWRW
jgi:hypothetical protein